jgi:UDP-N-acetylglucosamine acyltransferase
MSTEIHPTAIIHPSARLGENITVGPYSMIGPECVIGDGCQIGSSVAVHRWVELGKNVRVWHGASLGGDPQDLKFKGARTRVAIGEGTVIREFATVNLSTEERHVTRVGRNCFLMAYSHVAHECQVGDGVIMANSANLAGHVSVEDFAIIGGLTPVHQFCRIGCYAMVGGASAVQKDILPYSKSFGVPARVYGTNSVGLSRRGFPEKTRSLLHQAFRLIFYSNLNTSQAVERIKAELEPIPEIAHLLEFIESSKRGIAK